MEIIGGIIVAIIWYVRANRYNHYDEEDWGKIKDDWVKWEDKGR